MQGVSWFRQVRGTGPWTYASLLRGIMLVVHTLQPDGTLGCLLLCLALSSNLQLAILAPGVYITAAEITLTGTSQATPFVAGAITVMHQRYPAYTVQQILDKLKSTGTPVRVVCAAAGACGAKEGANLLAQHNRAENAV